MLVVVIVMEYDRDFLEEHRVLHTLHGSHAYGVARPDSDRDEKAVFLPPAQLLIGMESVNEIRRDEPVDLSAFSVKSAFRAIMAGTQNVVEVFFVSPDDIIAKTAIGEMLIERRSSFLSKSLAKSYFGFARGQSEKIQHGNINEQTRRKTAYHMIRSIKCGIEVLRDKALHTKRPEQERQLLHSIRDGAMKPERAVRRFEDLRSTFDELMDESNLRDGVDGSALQDLYIDIVKPHIRDYLKEESDGNNG